jgi:hypothetical protein
MLSARSFRRFQDIPLVVCWSSTGHSRSSKLHRILSLSRAVSEDAEAVGSSGGFVLFCSLAPDPKSVCSHRTARTLAGVCRHLL